MKEKTLLNENSYIFLFELHSITILNINYFCSDETNKGLDAISVF